MHSVEGFVGLGIVSTNLLWDWLAVAFDLSNKPQEPKVLVDIRRNLIVGDDLFDWQI